MITNLGDIKNQIIVRLGISTSTAYYTDDILDDWINSAYKWTISYKKWPFSEGRVSTTFASGSGENGDEWNFEGYKADSFRIIKVGGKRLKKLNFEDYQIFREEEPSGSDRVYSDYGRTVYINPNADVSGTLVAYGQYLPIDLDATDPSAQTIFTGGDEDGNEAIVEECLSYAFTREKKEQESNFHHQKSLQILDSIWKRILDEQHKYQTHADRGGMFERFDVLQGGFTEDILKRDQF